MTTSMSAREFNQNLSVAKRDALESPVIVTDRGKPSHVLLSYDEYLRLKGGTGSIVEKLRMKNPTDYEFEPVSFKWKVPEF